MKVELIFLGRPCFICGGDAEVVLVRGGAHTFRCVAHVPDYIPKDLIDVARDAQMAAECVLGRGVN